MVCEALLEELRTTCGSAYVFSDARSRHQNSATTEVNERRCGVVVYPSSAQEVSKLLQLASRYKVAVWPFSRGNNWGYGTKNALQNDAIIVVLERMNRILEINRELAYVVIEPGVTQQQLHEHLSVHCPELIADCTDSTPLGSVLGNAIERGYGYTPYGDHFGHLCGLEIVLPSGEFLRTGNATEQCPTWHTHRWGSGPFVDGLFSQSNLGVVVKAGVWLRPKPDRQVLFLLDVLDEEALPSIVDGLRALSLDGTLQSHVHTVNGFQTLSVLQRYPADLRDRGEKIPEEQLSELLAWYGVPQWTAIGGIYGTRSEVRLRQRKLSKVLGASGRLTLFDERKIKMLTRLSRAWQASRENGSSGLVIRCVKRLLTKKDFSLVQLLPDLYGLLSGKPTWAILRSAYFKSCQPAPQQPPLDPAADGCGLIWLAPAIPLTGSHVAHALGLAREQFDAFGFNLSATLTMMNSRTQFLLLGIFFCREVASEKRRAGELYQALWTTFAANGYQLYRSGIPEWESQSRTAAANAAMLCKVKDTLDPLGTLAPGRYGIEGTR